MSSILSFYYFKVRFVFFKLWPLNFFCSINSFVSFQASLLHKGFFLDFTVYEKKYK